MTKKPKVLDDPLFKSCKNDLERFAVANGEVRHLEGAIEGFNKYISCHTKKAHFEDGITIRKAKRNKYKKRLRRFKKVLVWLEKRLEEKKKLEDAA